MTNKTTTLTIPADVDPSDVFDTDREWEIPNVDIPAPPHPGTTSVHPARCRCLPCRAEAEFFDYVARMEVCECEIDWKCGVCRHGEVAR